MNQFERLLIRWRLWHDLRSAIKARDRIIKAIVAGDFDPRWSINPAVVEAQRRVNCINRALRELIGVEITKGNEP